MAADLSTRIDEGILKQALNWAASFPDSNKGRTFIPVPLREQLTGSVKSMLYFLLGAVLLRHQDQNAEYAETIEALH